jgi:beta-glucanase (GH16 family)
LTAAATTAAVVAGLALTAVPAPADSGEIDGSRWNDGPGLDESHWNVEPGYTPGNDDASWNVEQGI